VRRATRSAEAGAAMHDAMSNCGDVMLLKNAPAPLEQELDPVGTLRATSARRPLFLDDHLRGITHHERQFSPGRSIWPRSSARDGWSSRNAENVRLEEPPLRTSTADAIIPSAADIADPAYCRRFDSSTGCEMKSSAKVVRAGEGGSDRHHGSQARRQAGRMAEWPPQAESHGL
jgi:hypothetical protein